MEKVHAFEAAHDCHIPVIAGGGVYTGEDIYNILQLGAEGVQMGTRFVATEECDADPAFKESYVHARKEDIEIIQSPVGMPGRAIHSSFLEKVKAGLKRPKSCPFNCIKTCDVSRSPYCIMLALYNAFRGRLENGYAFCGTRVFHCATDSSRIRAEPHPEQKFEKSDESSLFFDVGYPSFSYLCRRL